MYEQPCRFHDFAITKNYAVFMHMPLVFDPSIMVKVRPLLSSRQGAGQGRQSAAAAAAARTRDATSAETDSCLDVCRHVCLVGVLRPCVFGMSVEIPCKAGKPV